MLCPARDTPPSRPQEVTRRQTAPGAESPRSCSLITLHGERPPNANIPFGVLRNRRPCGASGRRVFARSVTTARSSWSVSTGVSRMRRSPVCGGLSESAASAPVSGSCLGAHGVHRKPMSHVLSPAVDVHLAKSREVQQRPGKQSDRHDATWMVERLAPGWFTPSVVPPPKVGA